MSTHWINYDGRRIKKIQVFTMMDNHIDGFRFYDVHQSFFDPKFAAVPFFEIGAFNGWIKEIVLADNEQIVGITAKLRHNNPAIYTDF